MITLSVIEMVIRLQQTLLILSRDKMKSCLWHISRQVLLITSASNHLGDIFMKE